jgi:hypothetical protein
MGQDQVGWQAVRQVTAKNRYARALAAVTDWCRTNRHRPIKDQHAHLSAMMRGHYAYYGVSGNYRRLSWYADKVASIWKKWPPGPKQHSMEKVFDRRRLRGAKAGVSPEFESP